MFVATKLASNFLIFAQGLSYGLSKSKKRGKIHVDLTLALTRCSCSALREVAVFVRECGKCKPLYVSVIERCVTLPVGTWSVARKQSFRFDGGHVHHVTISHFE